MQQLITDIRSAMSARAERVELLSIAIDDLKDSLQICQRLHALRSFNQFEMLARLVSDLGRQCGGWRKRLNGQNRTASMPAGRAESLSVRGKGRNPDGRPRNDPRDAGIKNGGDWFDWTSPSMQRRGSHGSSRRKAASALIAKIPFELAYHIGRSWLPVNFAHEQQYEAVTA